VKKVLFIDSMHPLLEKLLENAGFNCEHDYESSKEVIESKLHQYIGIVIRSRFKIDTNFIDKAKNLKFIARGGSGLENIDVKYAESKNISCLNSPEANAQAVAEQALGMLLNLFNNINKADSEVRKGIWKREENRGIELSGKTVSIIGFGNNGKAFAKVLSGFGCEVLVFDKYLKHYSTDFAKESDWEEIFEKTDIISFHVPLTEETLYFFNQKLIEKFKKPIYLINISRGKVVKTSDLVEGIKNGKILGACLDVLEYEKVSFENLSIEALPEDFKFLTESPKTVLTPHIAGWSIESNEKIAKVLFNKIQDLKI